MNDVSISYGNSNDRHHTISFNFYEYTGSMDLSYITIFAHDHDAKFALFRPLLYK